MDLKKIARSLGIFIFILSLSSALFVSAIAEFTEYDNMKSMLVDILSLQLEQAAGQVESDQLSDQLYQTLLIACESRDTFEVPLSEIGEFGDVTSVIINCADFKQLSEGANTMEYLLDIVAGNVFDSFYYKQYDCEFVDCLQTADYLVIMSAQGNQFFKSVNVVLWAGVVIGSVLIIAYSETWASRLNGFGWPMIFTGASYFFVSFLRTVIFENFPLMSEAEQAGINIAGPIDALMKPMMDSLMMVLTIGVVLIVASYVVGYYENKRKEEKKNIKTIRLKK